MSKSLQQRLLDAVVQHFPKRVAAIEALSNLLGVGRDGIYRRMRGDTILSPKEVEVIALTFHVSLDDLIFGQSDTVIFSFNGFDESTRSFIDYLERFESELSRASSMGDGHFYYASVELPLFQSCFFKELICFKLYIWGLTVLGYEALQDRPFSFELLPVPLLATIQRIQELYVNVPSTELWGRNVVDNTLNQIEYHFSSGHFRSPDDALLLCE
ncbi:MAG: helix-turn-helix transcriptional regulator, partial [Bacteroidota bacterium]